MTDYGSVTHYPRPWPEVGVEVERLVGLYDVPRDMSGDSVPPPSDEDGGRPGAGPDAQSEKQRLEQKQKEVTLLLHCNYFRTAGTNRWSPLPPSCTPNNKSGGVGVGVGVGRDC